MAKFLRKRAIAERYGDVSIRTAERMVADGRLPPPVYRGRIPMCDELALDASDRATAVAAQKLHAAEQKSRTEAASSFETGD
jgi:hypothetical protein